MSWRRRFRRSRIDLPRRDRRRGKGTALDPQLIPSSRDRAILIYWRLPRPNGQILVCTSYRTSAGLELRAGLDGEPAVRQAAVATHADARRLAELWRHEISRVAAA
jgi:hypothetical protein